uniref:Uncharacterized protein n=1 Tax=Arundo donax TaxID=35708 RepID=A0A0A8YZX2_ARUDO
MPGVILHKLWLGSIASTDLYFVLLLKQHLACSIRFAKWYTSFRFLALL